MTWYLQDNEDGTYDLVLGGCALRVRSLAHALELERVLNADKGVELRLQVQSGEGRRRTLSDRHDCDGTTGSRILDRMVEREYYEGS